MRKVVMYSEKKLADMFEEKMPDVEVIHVSSIGSFIDVIIAERDMFCGAVQADPAVQGLSEVTKSIKRSFPYLHVCYICDDPPSGNMESVQLACSTGGLSSQVEVFCGLFYRLAPIERRRFNRFSWPLRGSLRTNDEWKPQNVFSLSAGGAFLEFEGKPPEEGSKTEIVIEFQNCRLQTECEILNPRHASSKLPFGLGIRFVGLTEDSEKLVNTIVNDALVKAILEEPEDSAVPTIGEEDLTFQFELT